MTPEEVKAKLRTEGKTLRQWTDEKGIDYRAAQGVLNGTNRGYYGKTYEAAVALGLVKAA